MLHDLYQLHIAHKMIRYFLRLL